MYKVAVCGAFNFGAPSGGGQLIKTRIFADELKKRYTKVFCIDTVGLTNKVLLFPRLLYALIICKNIIVLPAQNAVVLESQFLRWFNIFFKRGLHYVVIGGWLQDFLLNHSLTKQSLGYFDGIYVETTTMLEALSALGFSKVWVLPNFKNLRIIDESEMSYSFQEPFKLVMLARVTEKKGTKDAVDIIQELNKKAGRFIYSLDIYGPIGDEDTQWFNNLKKTFTDAVEYKGVVEYNETVNVLSSYFALLFPTKYYTEGIPGTIIDSYAAGLPVISSRWKSFADVIDDGVTGVGYEFNNLEELYNILEKLCTNPERITSLKRNCLLKARDYLPTNAMQVLLVNLK